MTRYEKLRYFIIPGIVCVALWFLLQSHFGGGTRVSSSWPGNQPFVETFADNHNNWSLPQTNEVGTSIANGAYVLEIKAQDWHAAEASELTFTENVDVQVDAVLADGDPGGQWGYGLAVRSTGRSDSDSAYIFMVRGTGAWFFSAHISGSNFQQITSGRIPFVYDTKKPMTLKLVAVDNIFTLYLNGIQVGVAADSTLPNNGTPKLEMVYAYNGTGADHVRVEFRNFKVTPLLIGPTATPTPTVAVPAFF